MSLPFWMMGEPDTSVVNKGQQFLTKNSQKVPRATKWLLSAVALLVLYYKRSKSFFLSFRGRL